MNKNNLQLIVNHLRSGAIKQEDFKMSSFNDMDGIPVKYFIKNPELICGTVGCVIGHSISLNMPLFMEIAEKFQDKISLLSIYFEWSETFTGCYRDSIEWDFMFNGWWNMHDNTIEGAANRIEFVILNKMKEHPHYQKFNSSRIWALTN